MENAALKNKFTTFAQYGTRQLVAEIDGAKFSKLCKDCGLIGAGLSATDVDIIFAKVKDKTQRKINYVQFVEALRLIAEKKKKSFDAVCETVIGASGPTTNATRAEYVKFHDDKSTYTGVYAKGGPTNVDRSRDLSGLCDRTPADVRGVKC